MMGFFDGFGDSLGSLVGGALGGIGSIAGGAISATNSQKVAQMNINAQREFAQNGVRWRVADAKAAGVHPSVALGMHGASFTPVAGYAGDYGVSDAFTQFGQGISRAAQAKMTREEREQAQARQEMQDTFQLAQMNKQNQLADAQIDLINSEVARNKVASYIALNRSAQVPSMPLVGIDSPMSGQGDSSFGNKPSTNSDGSYYGPTAPLLTLARSGNTLLDVINPDLADSVTESTFRNAIASIAPEWSIRQGYVKPPIDFLTPEEQRKVRRGELELSRFPGGWSLSVPRMKRYYERRQAAPAWSKALDKKFFDWLDSLIER